MHSGFDFQHSLTCVATQHVSSSGPQDEGIPKGVVFSPDGLLIASGTSRSLRIFDIPHDAFQDRPTELGGDAALAHSSGRIVAACTERAQFELPTLLYDYCWHPRMSSYIDPDSALCLASFKDQPVALWDVLRGSLRSQYVLYNHLDEVTAATSIAFDCGGEKIYAGTERGIQIFDVHRPGRASATHQTATTRKAKVGQKGIISCIAPCPTSSTLSRGGGTVVAVGSYAGSVWVYDARTCVPECSLHDGKAQVHGAPAESEATAVVNGGSGVKRGSSSRSSSTGVTQVKWSPDGTLVYAGFRGNAHIAVWDARKTSAPLCKYYRNAATNQKLTFDLDAATGTTLVTPCLDAGVRVYDTVSGVWSACVGGFPDAVNGVSLHPCGLVFACASGERHTPGSRRGSTRVRRGDGRGSYSEDSDEDTAAAVTSKRARSGGASSHLREHHHDGSSNARAAGGVVSAHVHAVESTDAGEGRDGRMSTVSIAADSATSGTHASQPANTHADGVYVHNLPAPLTSGPGCMLTIFRTQSHMTPEAGVGASTAT